MLALLLVAQLSGWGPFEVEAERLFAERRAGVYVAEGGVVLRRPGLVVHAERVTFDESAGRARAEGRVLLIEGAQVVSCERVELVLPELRGGLERAELRIKRNLAFDALSRRAREEVLSAGEDELILAVDRAERLGDRRYKIEGGSFTPCDCGPEEAPTWRIAATEAEIDLDSGAYLEWPVFYAKDLPVFALPAFYVPLGPRRSGLLVPRLASADPTGLAITQPVFLALGRSWDATLDASYYFARGPAPAAELRWAPSRASAGELHARVLFDFGAYDPAERAYSTGRPEPIPRFALGLDHETRWEGSVLAADLNLSGDPAFGAEFAEQFLARQAETASSRLTWAHANDAVRIALGAAVVQELRPHRFLNLGELREIALMSGDPGPGDVRHRLIELRADAAPHPLLGPLYGEAVLTAQGFLAPLPRSPRFFRADLRPAMSLPIDLGLAVLEPSVALRLSAWSGRDAGETRSATRFAPVVKTTLFSELSRDFDGLVHRIRPELEHLLVPVVLGEGPGPFRVPDEVDLLAAVHQVRGKLGTELWGRGGRLAAFDLALGRDLGLDDAGLGLSELSVEGQAAIPFGEGWSLRLDGLLALDVERGEPTEARGELSFVAGRFGSLGLTYGAVGDTLPARSFVAPEELLASRTIDRRAYLGPADFSAALARAALGGDGAMAAGLLDVARWVAQRSLVVQAAAHPLEVLSLRAQLSFELSEGAASTLLYASGSARYSSPCECFDAELIVGFGADREAPDVRVLVDLARLGSASSGP